MPLSYPTNISFIHLLKRDLLWSIDSISVKIKVGVFGRDWQVELWNL